ncbi:hypothetical protein [Rhodoblastus sp.]|uniref:hypothetical protein n=1 Tax=Rhodoblastus sp. TaxID=1962975 RepID=UPI003F9DBCF4
MSNIKASDKHVPLYLVAEHIAGDLGRPGCVLVQSSDDENEYEPVADEQTDKAWDSALEKLICSVKNKLLKVSGRRDGSWAPEETPSGVFADLAVVNPFADIDFEIEDSGKIEDSDMIQDSGKAVFELDQDGFGKIFINKGLCVRPQVIWTRLTADSGAEVLKLWPRPIKPTAKARGKSACSDWLVSERRAGPPKQTKEKYKDEAIERFGVGPDQFRTVWDEAAKVEPSKGWGRAGRPKKSSDQKSSGQ